MSPDHHYMSEEEEADKCDEVIDLCEQLDKEFSVERYKRVYALAHELRERAPSPEVRDESKGLLAKLEADKNDYTAIEWMERGREARESKDFHQAVVYFTKAINLSPAKEFLALAYMNRGTMYIEIGDHHQAISDFNRSLQVHPDHDNVHAIYFSRGSAYLVQEDATKAKADFHQAIALSNDFNFIQMVKEILATMDAVK